VAPITVDFSAAPSLVGPSLDDAPAAVALTPQTIAEALQVVSDVDAAPSTTAATAPVDTTLSDGAPRVPRAPGEPKHTEDKCNRWRETRAHEIEVIKPHVVVVMYGSFDMLDRKWDGSDTWTHIGLPDFDAALRTNIADMTDLLGAGGARVIWATYPRVRTGVRDGVRPAQDYPEFDEMRVDRLNTFIREAVAQRPFAGMLELRRYMQSWPKGELDPVKRPDGLHPNDFEAINIAEWIAEQVVYDVARR
jgi:hypothetical protein